MNKMLTITYKLVVAAVVMAAIVAQFAIGITTNPNFSITNFFSFFTIESNIFAMVMLVVSSFYLARGKKSHPLDILRGAATLYMVITGIVYVTLLSGLEESLYTPTPWVNFVLHYAFPVVAFLDWVIDRPAFKVTLKQGLYWLLFPILYAVYSLIRGPIVGWYPYPFLNPTDGGYGKVAIVAIGIAVAAYILTAILTRVPARKR